MSLIPILNVDEAISKANKVGIIGYPGAGKTTLANKFISSKKVIHTDDYLHHSHDDRPMKIICDLKEPYIVEGNEVTRLVKRGVEFDLLILVTGSERDDKGVRGLQGRVDKFLNEYDRNIYTINPRR